MMQREEHNEEALGKENGGKDPKLNIVRTWKPGSSDGKK